MLQVEELRAALDVIKVSMGEGDYVEIVSLSVFQLLFESFLKIDLW
ncbi:MAG: hypothetical protein U0231_13610 [Nitrospiraceae bacterium]